MIDKNTPVGTVVWVVCRYPEPNDVTDFLHCVREETVKSVVTFDGTPLARFHVDHWSNRFFFGDAGYLTKEEARAACTGLNDAIVRQLQEAADEEARS